MTLPRSMTAAVARHYEPRQVSMLLTAASLVLWAISLLQLSQTGLVADDMGYVHALPLTFWIAIGTLTLASSLLWVSPRPHTGLLALQLSLFVAMFWLTPLFLGKTLTGSRYTFGYDSLTRFIPRYGHLDPVSQWYHNWPAFNLLQTDLQQLGGIDHDTLIIWATAPIQFLVVLPLCIFFRYTLGPGNHWAPAAWFFVLVNWTAQTYYSPQALGYILLIILFFLLARGLATSNAGLPLRLVGLLVIAGLPVTHLLSALTGLFVLGAVEAQEWRKRRSPPILTMMLGFVILAWQLYYSVVFFGNSMPTFFDQAMKFDLMWSRNVSRAQMGSSGHLAVVNIRMWLTVLTGIVALGGLALMRRFRLPRDGTLVIMGLGIGIMLPFQFYGNEFLSRLLMYILPVMAYFTVRLLRTRVTALVLVLALLVAIPFGIVGLHGNAMADTISPNQRAYWHFLEDNTVGGNLGFGGMTMGWTLGEAGRYTAGFDWVAAYGSRWVQRLGNNGWQEPGIANYLAFTGYEDAAFRNLTDFPDGVAKLTAQASEMTELSLIYDNGEVRSFYHDGKNISVRSHF